MLNSIHANHVNEWLGKLCASFLLLDEQTNGNRWQNSIKSENFFLSILSFFVGEKKQTKINYFLIDNIINWLILVFHPIEDPIRSDPMRYHLFGPYKLTIEFNKINNDKLLNNNNFNAIPKICESTRKQKLLGQLWVSIYRPNKAKKEAWGTSNKLLFFITEAEGEKKRRTRKKCISNRCQFDWYLMCSVLSPEHH